MFITPGMMDENQLREKMRGLEARIKEKSRELNSLRAEYDMFDRELTSRFNRSWSYKTGADSFGNGGW